MRPAVRGIEDAVNIRFWIRLRVSEGREGEDLREARIRRLKN